MAMAPRTDDPLTDARAGLQAQGYAIERHRTDAAFGVHRGSGDLTWLARAGLSIMLRPLLRLRFACSTCFGRAGLAAAAATLLAVACTARAGRMPVCPHPVRRRGRSPPSWPMPGRAMPLSSRLAIANERFYDPGFNGVTGKPCARVTCRRRAAPTRRSTRCWAHGRIARLAHCVYNARVPQTIGLLVRLRVAEVKAVV
jgi:hypothetical protein